MNTRNNIKTNESKAGGLSTGLVVFIGLVSFSLCLFALSGIEKYTEKKIDDDGFYASRKTLDIKGEQGEAQSFTIQIAKTKQQRMRGLMFRKSLKSGYGMLFVEEEHPRIVKMWMRNTFIPLDMIFFNRAGEIVYIHEGAIPHDETSIGPNFPVFAVLEIIAGDSARLGLRVGQKIEDVEYFFE